MAIKELYRVIKFKVFFLATTAFLSSCASPTLQDTTTNTEAVGRELYPAPYTTREITNINDFHIDDDQTIRDLGGELFTGVIEFKDDKKNTHALSEWTDGKQKGFYTYLNENGHPEKLLYTEQTPEGVKIKGMRFEYKYYANGRLKSVGTFLNKLQHGTWRTYYPNGRLETVESWYHGEPIGAVESYSDEGVLIMRGFVINRQQNGVLENYYPDGTLKSVSDITTMEDGKVKFNSTFLFDKNGNSSSASAP